MRRAIFLSVSLLLVMGPVSSGHAAPKVKVCMGSVEPSATSCQGVNATGCCDQFGRVFWCDGGKLFCVDCGGLFPSCGWNADGYYDCGQTPGSVDPSGKHLPACGGCPDECAGGTACSPACTGDCGKCTDPGEICLDDGTCYKPQCGNHDCGKDPKGFSCGVCKPGHACVEGLQQCMPLPAPCVPHKGPGCSGCGCEACVCQKHPSCCKENWDVFCASLCELDCGFDCSACPPQPSCGAMECGEYCGLTCGKCGPGEVCYDAKCCKTACGGKECGTDGCGGSCGQCKQYDECVEGKCVPCQPKCAGKKCGDDGCGGSCGLCGDGQFCVEGQCKATLCHGICGDKDPIDCGDGCQCLCSNDCFIQGNCCDKICESCPDLKGCCVPQCDGKQCGPNSCDGTCGYCGMGKGCVDGQCVECGCEGKLCGDDGCGKLCGYCTFGNNCKDGKCVPCTPDCAGKECGDDGCGWWCGDGCPPGLLCVGNTCGCKPHADTGCCDNAICWYDSCGKPGDIITDCGFMKCVDGGCKPCEPDCAGKDCGDDGCGGDCGTCSAKTHCEGGRCVAGAPEPKPEVVETADVAEGADVEAAGVPDQKKPSKLKDVFGGCGVGGKAGVGVALLLLAVGAVMLAGRRRLIVVVAGLSLLAVPSCSSSKSPADAIDLADAQDADSPDLPDDLGSADQAVDPGKDIKDLPPEAADTVEVPDTSPPLYDCKNLPKGPFKLEKVPFAVASEDIAFDSEGNVVGSNMEAIFKSKAGEKPKLWIPNVHTRAGLRFLPNGTLVVCDDQKGQLRAFDPEGNEKVLLEGLQYPNGLTVDLKGFIYLTEHNAARVLRIHPYSGEYTVLTNKITNPNGIVFNPEYTKLYIGSFGGGWIYAMSISPDGVPGKLVEWAAPIGPGGALDGLGVDACGNVYVCEYGGTDIYRIPPSGGPAVKIVHGDDTYLPNMQWGAGLGWDPNSLYIPDGWKVGVWRLNVGVPSAPRAFP